MFCVLQSDADEFHTPQYHLPHTFSDEGLPTNTAARFASQLSQHLAATQQLTSTLRSLLDGQASTPQRQQPTKKVASGRSASRCVGLLRLAVERMQRG